MVADLVIKQGDLLPGVTVVARDAIGPADLEGATSLFRMVNVLDGSTKVNASATAAVGITFTASGAVLTATDHGLNDGEAVTLKTTGVLPGNLSNQREYFVVNASTNTFGLALTKGGTAITTSSAGTGVHTVLTGRVSYDWQGTDTDTPGTYFGEVQTIVDGKPLTYPNTRQLLVEVVSELV